MGQIDSLGTFTGTVLESGVNTTKNGFPQWVFRVLAVRKFIETKEEMAHFGIAEPAYVDWNFEEDAVGYMCLFNNDGPLKNYEQVQLATGWDGTSFDTLGEPIVGKSILFRIQAKSNYTKDDGSIVDNAGKLEIGWVDAADAPPTRQLKVLDAAAVKDLSSKFLTGLKKAAPPKPVAAKAAVPAAAKPGTAKPATKPAVASSPATPVVKPTPTPAPSASPAVESAVESTSAPAVVIPPTATKSPKKPPSAPALPKQEAVVGLPKETSQSDAWAFLCSIKGDNEDTVIQDAWLSSCAEVAPDLDEDKFTPAQWAKVRDIVIKDLALDVANAAAA